MVLVLLYTALLCAFQVANCEIASCGNFTKDWFPNVAPQSSVAPYVLNVSDADVNFTVWSWKHSEYRKEGVQTGLLGFMCPFTVKAQCFSDAYYVTNRHKQRC